MRVPHGTADAELRPDAGRDHNASVTCKRFLPLRQLGASTTSVPCAQRFSIVATEQEQCKIQMEEDFVPHWPPTYPAPTEHPSRSEAR